MQYRIIGPYAYPDNPECQCSELSKLCVDECHAKNSSDYICYTGPNLPGTGIQVHDSLTLALQKIDNEILILRYGSTTSTTTTHL